MFAYDGIFADEDYIPGKKFYYGGIAILAALDITFTSLTARDKMHLWPVFLISGCGAYFLYFEAYDSISFMQTLPHVSTASDPSLMLWGLAVEILTLSTYFMNSVIFIIVFLGIFCSCIFPKENANISDVHCLNMSEMVPGGLVHIMGIIGTIIALAMIIISVVTYYKVENFNGPSFCGKN